MMRFAVESTKWLDVLPGGFPGRDFLPHDPRHHEAIHAHDQVNATAKSYEWWGGIKGRTHLLYLYVTSDVTLHDRHEVVFAIHWHNVRPLSYDEAMNGVRIFPLGDDRLTKYQQYHVPTDGYHLNRFLGWETPPVTGWLSAAVENRSATAYNVYYWIRLMGHW